MKKKEKTFWIARDNYKHIKDLWGFSDEPTRISGDTGFGYQGSHPFPITGGLIRDMLKPGECHKYKLVRVSK